MTPQRGSLRLTVGLVAVFAVLVLGACGEDDDESSAAGAASGSAGKTAADYQRELDKLYKGTFTEPTGAAITPESGKNVWAISVGQEAEATQNATKGMRESAEKLGWDFTVFDGQFDPSRALSGVEQALADKADGIVTLYLDCPPVKAGLQRADEQDVPVVAIEGSDCDELEPGDPALFDYRVKYAGDASYVDWVNDYAHAQATWVIAKTQAETKAIVTRDTGLESTKLQVEGILDEFEKCSACEATVLDFTVQDLGPPLQEKIEQALIENPDANAFMAAYEVVLTTGGANALKASGRLDELAIMGGEGSLAGFQLIRENGGDDACICYPTKWLGYASVDALARLFAGGNPDDTNSGMGFQAVDAEHNLPPKGKPYEPPIDYVAAYEELWGVN